ncbi:hypothetical protein M422DRAFT_54044 [Sphaerobolus stellatus SS14]|uniref:Uncharacterized protein n=1 Tax=Sphaerobolus stellatus (strain SS14) TaxID=990650 RepID=A0A0C9TJ85_SPHS4|nr:hypothetical protein M422DRAFT_54044 [Sphaerobolus stellatus SS14]
MTLLTLIEPYCSKGPTLENFCFNLAASLGTPWNKRTLEIFVEDFLDSKFYKCEDEKEVTKAARTHLQTLCAAYRDQVKLKSDITRAAKLSVDTRNRHRLNRYYRCLHTVRIEPGLHQHEQIILEMGVDGMSSDESGHEEDNSRGIGSCASRGNWPLLRKEKVPALFSKRHAIRSLPVTSYDAEWLMGLSDNARADLKVKDDPYDFTIPDELVK